MNIPYEECPHCSIMTPVYCEPVHKCHSDPRIIYTQRCSWCGNKFIVNGVQEEHWIPKSVCKVVQRMEKGLMEF